MIFSNMPDEIPIFPLPEVLLLPRGCLPLNIFEPRYINMVDDALKSDRLIGMIQIKSGKSAEREAPEAVFATGCVGRIVSFEESPDGRYFIMLNGLFRFDVVKERVTERGYRKAAVDWARFKNDLDDADDGGFDREAFFSLFSAYLKDKDMLCDSWGDAQGIPTTDLVAALAMICPFDSHAKQVLLEAPDLKTRVRVLKGLVESDLRPPRSVAAH